MTSDDHHALAPALDHARSRGITVRPLQFVSRSPADDIRDVARAKGAGLIVMGWHKPVWTRTVLGGTVKAVLRDAAADVAVFIDRGIAWPPRRVLVALTGTPHDEAALRLAARIGARHGAAFTVVGVVRPGGSVSRVQMPASVHGVRVIESASPIDALVQEAASHDLTVLGVAEGWQREPSVFGVRSEGVVARCPSSLLVVCGLAERNAAAA